MSNTKWYEDENLVNLSRKCDEVYFDQDEEGMCILVDECYRYALLCSVLEGRKSLSYRTS